jgi:small subunit ribosomal protein S18
MIKKKTKRAPRKAAADDIGRKRTRLLKADQQVDYRDYEFLGKFMTERGKILPGRVTGTNAKQQRQVKRAIRRARVMGLLP